MADDRDLVFVSYSHRDAGWAEAVRVMVEPPLHGTGFALWVDRANLRAGDVWPDEIRRAIGRSRLAILLISKDFLDSAFIRDHELPELRDRGVPLLPVLAGDCLWDLVLPELASVQWLAGPSGDDALNRHAHDPGELDGRLARIARQLMDLLPQRVPVRVRTTVPAPPVAAVSALEIADRPGDLDGVPALPDSYVERPAVLAGLVDAVVEQAAVGVTGVGLHGQGGIGKSVLAAALARDDAVRSRFPDGVHWVTLGERVDVLGVQLDLLRRLGGTSGPVPPRTSGEARAALVALLADRRVLIVADDVWTTHAAAALQVTGPRGRLLLTTREAAVLDGVGARHHPVGILSPDEAARLAGRVLGRAPGSLPPAATTAFAQVGHVALAVSLLAAAVGSGAAWDRVAETLRAGADAYGDLPYANTFRAMRIAADRLPDGLTRRWLSLTAFPEDEMVPVAAVARLWAATHGDDDADTRRLLGVLAGAALLTFDDDGVSMHDLQHAYLALHGGHPATAHAEVLSGYRPLLSGDGSWASLPPDEPYVWDHLVRHLRGAGEWRELHDTVTDPAFLARRIQAAGTHAAETDLVRAARALPDRPTVRWWQDWLARHAGLLEPAGDETGADGCPVAPTMRAWLEADPDRPGGIRPRRLDAVMPPAHLIVRWGLVPPSAALVRTLDVHEREISLLAWSPDGRLLASWGYDGLLQLVSPDDAVVTVLERLVVVTDLTWSPTGDRIAATEIDGRLHCWGVPTGAVLLEDTIGNRADALAWSPDGRRLATGESDGSVRLRDADTAEVVATVDVGAAATVELDPISLAWSSDGGLLAIGHMRSGGIRLLDPAGDDVPPGAPGAPTTALTMEHGIRSVTWSPDGTWLLALDFGGSFLTWNRRSDATVRDHTAGVWREGPSWSPDGSRIAAADSAGRVQIADPADPRTPGILGHDAGVEVVAWAPDGTALAVVRTLALDVREPRTGEIVARSDDRGAAWAPDGARLAVADDPGVTVWDPRTGARRTISVPLARLQVRLAWSADGNWVSAEGDDRWSLVGTRDGRIVPVVESLPDRLPHLAWSPHGCRYAVESAGETRIWEPGRPEPVHRVPHTRLGTGTCPVWSPDGRLLAVHAVLGFGLLVCSPDRGPDTIRTVDEFVATTPVWSPDGTRLAHASLGATLHVVDAADLRTTVLDGGHQQRVRTVAWSPDGLRIATGSADGRLQIWDDDGTGFVRTAHLNMGPVDTLHWTPAGLAVGGPWGAAVLDLHDAGTDAPPPL